MLTFKGAKSGKIRKTPLMRIEHNGTYAVVASNAGAPTHPFWYRNIVANPLVELQDGAVKHEMRAHEVFGEEKNEWWKRADAAYSEIPRLPSSCRSRNSGARPGAAPGVTTKHLYAGLIMGSNNPILWTRYPSRNCPIRTRVHTTKMESLTTLLFKVSEHVAYITLNRPAMANAVSLELAEELEKVCARM